MQSKSYKRLYHCFVSLLLSYLLILLSIPLASTASVNRERNELASTIGTAPIPLLQQQNAARYRSGELLIRFRGGLSEQDKAAAIASAGARRKKQLRGESAIEKLELASEQNPETTAQHLRLNPAIEFVEPNFLITHDDLRREDGVLPIPTGQNARPLFDLKGFNPELSIPNMAALPQAQGIQPNDQRFTEQWALSNTGQSGGQFGSDISVTSAWQQTTGSGSTVIAVIDSGIDFTHPDLANNKWTNRAPGPDGDVNGWDYITDSGTVIDQQGHGTAVAGIIAARGNNQVGISGVMWQASLMSLRVLDNTGTGDIANAVEAIDYAIAHDAQVINISWGTTGESLGLKDAIERAIRRGVVVICSAGNSGQDLDQTPYYPASFNIHDLISVAATDNLDQLASWSNWSRRRVTVAAPGVNVLTTQMGGGYWTVNGTSASAPLVTGVAGLLKTQRAWLNPAEARRAIIQGARQVGALAGRVFSDGVVSAAGALGALRGPYDLPGGNGNGGVSPRPPDVGRNDGTHTHRGDPPTDVPNSDHGARNLDTIRNQPSHVPDNTTEPIQANLMCADCDPQGGGGGGGYYPPGDPNFSGPRVRPPNETGQPGVDLGSRNFNWSLPLVNLAGRAGLDLNLTLFYNSLVWTKDGTFIKFNADLGSPAPGFRLGFPILQQRFFNPETNIHAYMMVTPSGGRVELRQIGSSNIYESQDSSYTQLDVSNPNAPLVRTSDGTQLKFIPVTINSEYRCEEIKDRNGNYISASYNTTNGHLETITDTLGRVITFVYDLNNNLHLIQQSGIAHNLAEFYYNDVLVQPNFGGGLQVNGPSNNNVTVLTKVELPDDSFYTFEYNTNFGQVKKIRHFAPDGHELSYTLYNVDSSAGQTDCPRFTERRDWIEFGVMQQSAEVITTYAVAGDGSWSQVTLPDDTPANANDNVVQKEYFATSGWQKGLTTRTEVFLFGTPSVLKKWTTTTWTQDDEGLTYQKNPRPIEVNVHDAENNRRRTTIEYHPTYAVFGLPWNIVEYGSDGVTAIRRTYFDYKMDAAYIDRRIIGLLYQKQVFDGAWNLYSRVVFGYDWVGELFVDTPAPATRHDRTNYGPSFVIGRGNLQHIIRMDATDPNNSGKWTETKFRYNTTGSMLVVRDHDWHEIVYGYGDSFSDGVNRNTFAYPTTTTDAEGYQSTTKYKFETGAVTETRRPSSGTSGQGNVTFETHVMLYDGVGRLEKVTNQNSGFFTRFVYPPSMGYVQSYRNIKAPPAAEDYSVKIFDGLGRVRRTARFMPEKTDRYSAVMIHYNSLGQVAKQSKPTETNGDLTPIGDDVGGWVYTEQSYDWQGRPRVTTNPDGWTSEFDYTGCGCAGGEVVTARDEAGRRRKFYKDVLGRLWKVEELNWDQTVYSTTTYTYNVRDQLTQIMQQGQPRTLEYDGHGRLWKRTTPEQGLTEYAYNRDDTLSWMKDARGAKTNFVYTARHLVSSINYDLSGVLPGQNVAATPGAGFQYDAAGNRWQMTDGLGSVTYHYDSLSRMDWEERAFNGVPGTTYRLTYGYNNAGLASITNPWGSQVSYNHDHTGTVIGVTGSGMVSAPTYASGMQYRAFGGLKAMSYGNTKQLSVSYDSRMRPVQWDVAGLLGSEYRYDYFHEHTNRVTFARNLYDATLDRSYEYDQVARLSWTYTGAEASAHAINGQWGTQNGPYAQANFYDQHGNITQRLGWGAANPSFTATYTNNRRNGFSYDLAGNLTNDVGQSFTYDATGQQVTASFSGYSLTQGYDGDSLRVKKTENATTTENVTWTNVVGATVSGNSLTKTAATAWGNAGAASTKSIVSGDGYVEFSVTLPNTGMVGLSHTDTNQDYTSMEFALLPNSDGNLYVFESGVNRGVVSTFTTADVFRVAVEGGVVKYRKNGALVYTSTITPTYPLLVDAGLYQNGGTHSNVVISGNLGTTTYSLRSSMLNGQVVAEIANFGGTWGWLRGYVQLGGQLLAVQQDGVVRWVHEDPITKTKRMTDAGGTPISTIVFDPWGGAVASPWTQNPGQQNRRFTTYERDANESDEAMMRRYNRWHSRFDQPDPYGGAYDFTDPQSFNRYAYVQNDPVNFVDPSGLLPSDGECWLGSANCSFGGGGGFWGGTPRGNNGWGDSPRPGLSIVGSAFFSDVRELWRVYNTELFDNTGGKRGGVLWSWGLSAWFSWRFGFNLQDPRRTIRDFKREVYEKHGEDINRCTKEVFGRDYAKHFGKNRSETISNSPAISLRYNMRQLGRLTGVPVAAGAADARIGRNGTVRIASDYWTRSFTAVAHTYVHELGNKLSQQIALDPFAYGDPKGIGETFNDTDTGAKFEQCVFGKVDF